ASVDLPKDVFHRPGPNPILDFDQQPMTLVTPSPDGAFKAASVPGSNLVPFWVSQGGDAHFDATVVQNNTAFIVLWRGTFGGGNGEFPKHYVLDFVDYMNLPQ